MRILRISETEATINLNGEELVLISNSINEALELGDEFVDRVGIEPYKAKEFLELLNGILNQLNGIDLE